MALPNTDLTPVDGYTPMIGSMVAMLTYTRETTRSAVDGLDVASLDHQHDATANPIGALLAHMAAIEWAYITYTLGDGQPSSEEWQAWGPLLRLGPDAWAAARGRSLETHLGHLEAMRARTLDLLHTKEDAWLSARATLPWMPAPATNLWAWYHVMEDELSHRGQIRWLRSRLPKP